MSDQAEQISSFFEVKNQLGLHARPASLLVETASAFTADVHIEKDGEVVNAKSLMGLLMLSAGQGTVLKVCTQGADAQSAIDAIEQLFERNFDEE